MFNLGGFGGGGGCGCGEGCNNGLWGCLINLIILFIVMEFLCNIISGVGGLNCNNNNSCCC